MKAQSPAVAKVLKRLHYPLEIMLVCVGQIKDSGIDETPAEQFYSMIA
jgi:hypothetical protein